MHLIYKRLFKELKNDIEILVGQVVHRKTRMSHLTHLSHSGSLHGQKDSFFTYVWVILSMY